MFHRLRLRSQHQDYKNEETSLILKFLILQERKLNGKIWTEKSLKKKICEFRGWDHSGHNGPDGNIDGWANKGQIPVQIKNWSNAVGEREIKEFVGTLLGRKKKRGFFVAWKYTTKVYDYLVDIEKETGIKIELKTVKEILEGIMISSDEKMKIEEYYKNKKCSISDDAA